MNDLPKSPREHCETICRDGAWRRKPRSCPVEGEAVVVWRHLTTTPQSAKLLSAQTGLPVRTVRASIDQIRKHQAVWWWNGGFYIDSCHVPEVMRGRKRWKRWPGAFCPDCRVEVAHLVAVRVACR